MSIEVKDVMGRVAIAVLANASFADVVAAMKRFAVGAVTVVDTDRRPIGVVSEDDLLLKEIDTVRHSVSLFESRKQRREHEKAAAVTASQLMTSPAITVTPGTSVRDAARLMHTQRIKQLPVIDPVTGKVIGTLHQRDVLRVFTRPAGELEADIRALLPQPGPFTVEIDAGMVKLGGQVRRRSQAIALVEAVRNVEGVVDVVGELAAEDDDLIVVPPLM
ncbi:CBS domain protein [[Actinomadura] parvosata subsp. kistnae]|uniref:Signal transduction protein n=1 Tax=[Actinomadura] parvosata subsp. kistnae TaxID=1909395 RepID=A0A1V0AJU7_9ACTN|nr:CBS domain-containing protein [Nonomuraea sp. ATCC 55076]AQZ70491.1 signal transduction protein [Nonomuraea sp. ATCC 55076]SPL98943.1 CBS domain protein [Actinomadura parvosata subsp. kistnae]